MKLLNFKGKNVRGYLNFDINFRDDITFLIGINGSGKTTVLQLISSILLPSFQTLSSISFEEIYLQWLSNEEKMLNFWAKKKDDNIELAFLVNDEKKIVSNIKLFSIFDTIEMREKIENDFYQSKVIKSITKYESPVIMGIDRKLSLGVLSTDSFLKHTILRHRSRSSQRFEYEKIDEALWELKAIVSNRFRKIADEQDKMINVFQQELVKKAVDVVDISVNKLSKYKDFEEQLEGLVERQKILNGYLTELNLEILQPTFDKFFENSKKWLNYLCSKDENSEQYKTSLVNWMFNFCQLQKIDDITNLVKEYREKIISLKAPLLRFTNSLNIFFDEGNKNVIVGGSGDIFVNINRNNKEIHNDITELSSGEKQLIAILGQLSMCDITNSVCIIDEPELSLHISWQEKFIEALKAAGNNTQYIFATHAPAIIAEEDWQNNCEDLSEITNV